MGGGNTIDIKLIAKDMATRTIDGFKRSIRNIGVSFAGTTKTAGAFATKVGGVTAALTGMLLAFQGFDMVKNFLSSSVDEAANFEKAMTTLGIVAPRFGIVAEEAQQAAKELGDELRIGPTTAAESLQNLMQSGLGLEEATDLLERFTNEAMTGKSANIDLSTAVENLSFAYKTNSSELMDMSGISENFSDIIDRGRKRLVEQGMAVEDVTEEMAKYEGMIATTNLTLGSAEKFEGTYIDKKAEMENKIRDLKVQIGQGLMPILSELMDRMSPMIESAIEWAEAFDWGDLLDRVSKALDTFGNALAKAFEWVTNNKDIVVATLSAIALVLGGIAVVALVKFAVAAAPVILAITILAGVIYVLKKAWDENWGGIQEKTAQAWEVIKPKLTELWQWLKINVPLAIQFLRDKWNEYWPQIRNALVTTWNVIYPVILSIYNWLRTNIPLAIQEVKRVWNTNFLPILNALKGAWDSIGYPVFNAIRNALVFTVGNAVRGLGVIWNTVLLPIFQRFNRSWNAFGRPVFNILRNMLTIVIVGAINNLVANWNRLRTIFSLLSMWYNAYIAPTVNRIINIFRVGIGSAVNAFQAQWSRLVPIINSVLGPLRAVGNLASSVLGKVEGISGKAAAGASIEGRAKGGRFPSSTFLVGEEGPELVDPQRKMVYSNKKSKKMMGGGSNITVNINGYNRDPQSIVAEIKRQLARDNQNTNLGLNLGR